METVFYRYGRINILDTPLNESENDSETVDGVVNMLSTEAGREEFKKILFDGEHSNPEESQEEQPQTDEQPQSVISQEVLDATANLSNKAAEAADVNNNATV